MAENENKNKNDGKKKKGGDDQGKNILYEAGLKDLIAQYLEDFSEKFIEDYEQRSRILAALGAGQTYIDKVFGPELGRAIVAGTTALGTTSLEALLITAGMQPETAALAKESTDGLLDTIRRQHRSKDKVTRADVARFSSESLKVLDETKERKLTYMRVRKMLSVEERERLSLKITAFEALKPGNKQRWNSWSMNIDDAGDLRVLLRMELDEWEPHLTQLYGPVRVTVNETATGTAGPARTSWLATLIPAGIFGFLTGSRNSEASREIRGVATKIRTGFQHGSEDARDSANALYDLNNRR